MNPGGFEGVRAITLDAGGTLLEPHPSVGEIYARTLARRGFPAQAVEIEARFRTAFRALRGTQRGRVDESSERACWREIVRRSVGDSCPDISLDNVFDELWKVFARAESWRPRPGVEAGLQLLHARGTPLYVFSNWDARLRRVIAELGWEKFFADIFISSELGAEKPHPAAFARVRERLALPPGSILHVGDSPEHDYDGARAAGWQAVLLAPENTRLAPDVARHARLDELAARIYPSKL